MCPLVLSVAFVLFLDALHSYFGICGLALMNEPGLLPVYAPLNISERATKHLHQLHNDIS